MPRYKDRQQEPVDFRDTRLTSPTKMDKEQAGVVNQYDGKLMGQSLGDIGEGLAKGVKAVEDFKQGYDLAKISQEQAALNERFLNGATKEDIAQQEENEQIAVETEEQMWNTFSDPNADGKGGQIVETINIATKNAADAQAKLGRMKAQGKIGADEFVARSTLLTKQQIAKHPRLADEILAQTDKQWKISGIRDRVNLEQAANKAAADEEIKLKSEQRANFRKTHTDILYDPITKEIDYATMNEISIADGIRAGEEKISAQILADDATSAYEKWKQMNTPNKVNGETKIESNSKSSRIKLYRDTNVYVDMIKADPSNDGRMEASNLFRSRILQERRSIQSYFGRLKPNTEANAQEKNALDELQIYSDTYLAQFSGKEASEISTNLLTSISNIENNNFYNTFGMTREGIKAQAAILNVVPVKLRSGDTELGKSIHEQYKGLSIYAENQSKAAQGLAPLSSKAEYQRLLQMPYDSKANAEILKGANQARESDPTNEQDLNENHIRVFNSGIQHRIANIGMDANEEGQVKEFDNFITVMSDNIIRSGGETLTNKTKNQSMEVLDKAQGRYDNAIKTTMNRLKGMGVNIEATMVNGSLRFSEVGGTGNNAHEVNDLHTNVSSRITKVRGSLAMINGLAPTDAKVTEMLLNRMPFLKNMLEPQVEENKEQVQEQVKKKIPLRTL